MKSFLLPFILLGCATPPPAFEERLVDSVPDSPNIRSWRFTRDGRVAAFVFRLKGSEEDRVVVRRVAGKSLSLV